MSEYAVHFTKGRDGRGDYDVSMSILWSGRIEPTSPLGAARNLTQLGDSQQSACFSEIPLDLLDRLVERRSFYGIGFQQNYLIKNGGARVWYLDRDGPVAEEFAELVRDRMRGGIDPEDRLWKLTPFVDYPGTYGGTQYRFEWEREWRVPGGLRFAPQDVAFLFIPEELHGAARLFFEEQLAQWTGPAYLCLYLDPRWPMDRMQTELAKLST